MLGAVHAELAAAQLRLAALAQEERALGAGVAHLQAQHGRAVQELDELRQQVRGNSTNNTVILLPYY